MYQSISYCHAISQEFCLVTYLLLGLLPEYASGVQILCSPIAQSDSNVISVATSINYNHMVCVWSFC